MDERKVVLILFFIAGSCLAYYFVLSDVWVYATGEPTTAVVRNIFSTSTARGGEHYTLRLHYQDAQGNNYKESSNPKLNGRIYGRGDSVAIRYNANDPTEFVVEDGFGVKMGFFSVLISLVYGLGIWLYYRG